MTHESTRNARFWVFGQKGRVKLTLRPGQALEHWHGGPTDEGFYSFGSTYRHEGDHVTLETAYSARDCDGRMDYDAEFWCPITELDAHHPTDSETGEVLRMPWAQGELYPAFLAENPEAGVAGAFVCHVPMSCEG